MGDDNASLPKKGTLKLKQKPASKPSQQQQKKMNIENASVKKPPVSTSSIARKTPAQQAFDAARERRQKEQLPELAKKSHREKVAQYNEYLSKLSEHHDIPKVGPG